VLNEIDFPNSYCTVISGCGFCDSDTLPHYNAAIAIPLADWRILVIQVNAPSQSELDEEVDSLHDLRFDWH
jgi:hypothetical protein